MKRTAFSMLELLVTLAIVAMIARAVLQLLDHTTQQSKRINWNMTQTTALANCLDKLLIDTITAANLGAEIIVDNSSGGWPGASRLSLVNKKGNPGQSGKPSRIDWVAVADDERDDLVLYRRGMPDDDKEHNLYIPLCENLYSFEVELLNAEGLEDPNAPPALIQVRAQLYQSAQHDPEHLLTFSRTCSLRRFQ